jgi:hypothetical protein
MRGNENTMMASPRRIAAGYADAVRDVWGETPLAQLPKRFQCGICGRWFKTQFGNERDALGPLAQHIFGDHGLDEGPIISECGKRTSIALLATVDQDGVLTERVPELLRKRQ